MKANPVKKALREGKHQVGAWMSLGSVVAARFMARTGLPWMTVDMEHSHTDINTAALMFGAIADAGCVPLARVPAGKHEWIKMALDCGAMGIVAPMVMGPDEARAIVSACKYPPKGTRSVGGSLHAMNFGATPDDYYRRADDEILVLGLVGADGGGDMHDGDDALHGLGPAGVGEEIGLDQFEPRRGLAPNFGGDRLEHLRRLAHGADSAPDCVTCLQQTDDSPLAHEAGRPGDQHHALVSQCVFPRTTQRKVA